jgi:hypothetical protein
MSNKQRTCQGCGKTQDGKDEPFKKCAGCKSFHYCSEACQRADWENHKAACLKLRAEQAAIYQLVPRNAVSGCAFDKWVEARNRLPMLIRLFVQVVPAARVCDQLCLHLHVKADTCPTLDGYRVVKHFVKPVSELTFVGSHSFPQAFLDEIVADRPSLLPGFIQSPIALHLVDENNARIRSRLRVPSFPSDAYESPLFLTATVDDTYQKINEPA